MGQAALERQSILISEAPDDYVRVQSSLGSSVPRNIVVIPFLHENALKGVVELGFLNELTDIQLEFLNHTMPSIGITMNAAASRAKMKELLEESQTQTEELQSRQEKIKESNEALKSQQQELKVREEKLQRSNEKLQSQSEELQAQQEELRQINEQLEIRTRDLEKEREGIRVKNRELGTVHLTVRAMVVR